MMILVSILAFALTSGQLIRIPVGAQGITFLDITIFLFCVAGLLKSRFHLKRPPSQITAALIFILVAITSLALTPLRLTLSEYLISASYIVRFFLYVLFTWLIFSNTSRDFSQKISKALYRSKTLVRGKACEINLLSKAFFISGLSFAVLGLLQFIFFPNLDFLGYAGWDPHYFRTVSTFLDPNFAGAFLVLALLLLVHLGGSEGRESKRLPGGPDRTPRGFYLFFAITYLALLTTFSRSSYLMFLVSGLSFSLFKKSKRLILITLVLFAVFLLSFQIYTRLITKPRNIDRTQSASFRLSTWQQGLQLFQKSPLLGVGFNAYRYGIREYNLGNNQFLTSHGSSSNDSSLLFVAATTGILGLSAYLYFLWTLVKPLSEKNTLIIAGVAGLLIHSIFANSLFYPPVLTWILLISIIPKK